MVWKDEEACIFDEETFGITESLEQDEGSSSDEETPEQSAKLVGQKSKYHKSAARAVKEAHEETFGVTESLGDGETPKKSVKLVGQKSKYRKRAARAVKEVHEMRASAAKIQSRVRRKQASKEAADRNRAAVAIQTRSRVRVAKRKAQRKAAKASMDSATRSSGRATPISLSNDDTQSGPAKASAVANEHEEARMARDQSLYVDYVEERTREADHAVARGTHGGPLAHESYPPVSHPTPPRQPHSPAAQLPSPRARSQTHASKQHVSMSLWCKSSGEGLLSEMMLQSECVWRNARSNGAISQQGFTPWKRAYKSSAMRDVYATLRSETGTRDTSRVGQLPTAGSRQAPMGPDGAADAGSAEPKESPSDLSLRSSPRLAGPRLPPLALGANRNPIRPRPESMARVEPGASDCDVMDEREQWNAFCVLVSPRFLSSPRWPPEPVGLAGRRLPFFPLAVLDGPVINKPVPPLLPKPSMISPRTEAHRAPTSPRYGIVSWQPDEATLQHVPWLASGEGRGMLHLRQDGVGCAVSMQRTAANARDFAVGHQLRGWPT